MAFAWLPKTHAQFAHDTLAAQRVASSHCSSRPDDECDLLPNEASAFSTFDPLTCPDVRFSSRLKWNIQRKRERWSKCSISPDLLIQVWAKELTQCVERWGEASREEAACFCIHKIPCISALTVPVRREIGEEQSSTAWLDLYASTRKSSTASIH